MNEFTILMHLLSQTKQSPSSNSFEILGASEEELCDYLNYTGKLAKIKLHELMDQFSKSIAIFNLELKQNPFNFRWYLSQSSETEEFFNSNPFSGKPRIAATLCTILSLCLVNSGKTNIDSIQKLRNKKDIRDDIKELEKLKFVNVQKKGNQVSINPYLGYFMDIEAFLDLMGSEIG
ncbi:MAG: hypothetical protein DRO88_06935 [Promethearchaeia archaeon]|nr:MAG: hypothetical protein DRO88_06935 [Candidatus Lokiarchaeia archaeon]